MLDSVGDMSGWVGSIDGSNNYTSSPMIEVS